MGCPAKLAFEPVNRVFYIALALARRARQPVIRPQLVEHRTANALRSVDLELRALRHFESRHRVHQAHHAGLDHVVQLNVGRQSRNHLMRQPPHQRRVLLDVVAIQQRNGPYLLQLLAVDLTVVQRLIKRVV